MFHYYIENIQRGQSLIVLDSVEISQHVRIVSERGQFFRTKCIKAGTKNFNTAVGSVV